MIPTTLGTLLLALSVSINGESQKQRIKPSNDSSRENANRIFNAIHSAGRQWGSSYYHNGFSFFPAVMPKGTMLYHGASNKSVPIGPEWLAFEIEHAEGFAFSHKGKRRHGHGNPPGGKPPGDPKEPPPGEERQELRRRRSPSPADGGDDDDNKNIRGYLHTYQAIRDLHLLYVDGMSAGKTTMGTLDTQDLLLRENTTHHDQRGFDEYPRAFDLCDIADEWGFDGVVRMEAGFEVIHCDFNDGLDLISMTRTLMPEDRVGDDEMGAFMWARAIGERYNGLAADRLQIDFSSMVSALFFPVNISSSDADRPDLVRLESARLDELKDIKSYLGGVVRQPRRFTVNWQGVVDLIVSRFAKRLASMGLDSLSSNYFIDEVETLTATWYDAPPLPEDMTLAARDKVNRTGDAVDRCRKHYLRPAAIIEEQWSAEDELIFTSIDTVMKNICEDVFYVRELLFEAPDSTDEDNRRLQNVVEAGRSVVHRLMEDLGWAYWKQEQPCAADEVLVIAMWPFGYVEDHWTPGCRSIKGIQRPDGESYWRNNWGPPGGHKGDDKRG
ncbi:hypothetical protein B0T10DRAFT_395759 [Thelonectria olida]|uniref:Uncharacterized protein n=1 Tax=Thelonectria olida TaxID=1576542 RepID=A0A9P8WEB4_9HYPO|nr:hypothetical protein B0T10DRAFT_395759 [Thelonectria olida]